jgi:hypothetical protein
VEHHVTIGSGTNESTGSGRRFSGVVAMHVAATMTLSKEHVPYPRPDSAIA